MRLKSIGDKASLYFNTTKYLQGSQIFYTLARPKLLKRQYKIGKDFEKKIEFRLPKGLFIPDLDEDPVFLDRFNFFDIEEGRFTFLHETHSVDFKKWNVDAKPLWNYNLYYFEYGISIAFEWKRTGDEKYYNTFKNIVRSWISNTDSSHPSWQPYPISIRIVNWLICIEIFGEKIINDDLFYEEIIKSLYVQYKTIVLKQEKWLLGNHYFENLFSIVLSSYAFGDDDVCIEYCKKIEKEVSVQILGDGMHYELSPMYHKIILIDLIRLHSVDLKCDLPIGSWVKPTLSKMRNALLILEDEFDKTPLFNDSGDNVSRSKGSVLSALADMKIPRNEKHTQLKEAGYYKLSNGNAKVLIDAGIIGPPYMPGHGHCDCLSFEMSVDGKKIFCNSGTYQYQGERRVYFRSTKAHNTVTLDNHEQSQCWGEHRVAKRIDHVRGEVRQNKFVGEYRNYCGQTHRRRISLSENALTVLDTGKNTKKITSYLHLVPECCVNDELDILIDNVVIARVVPIGSSVVIHRDEELTDYSPEFGILQTGTCIEFSWENDNQAHGYKINY